MANNAANRPLMILLSLNAAALISLLVLLMARSELLPSAMAQTPAGNSASVVVAPGQLSSNIWGCYVLDTRTNSLCVYQYQPGQSLLKLQAARGIEQDMMLRSFNTLPLPGEIAELVAKERQLQSGVPATAPVNR